MYASYNGDCPSIDREPMSKMITLIMHQSNPYTISINQNPTISISGACSQIMADKQFALHNFRNHFILNNLNLKYIFSNHLSVLNTGPTCGVQEFLFNTGPTSGVQVFLLNTGPTRGVQVFLLNTGPTCGFQEFLLNTGPACGV